MASQADLAILVCGQPEVEQYKDYWAQDCSAAMQNLLLAAHDLGLGAVWCGIYPRQERVEKFRKLFGIPKKAFPLGLVPMGYPATKPEKVDRFKQERVHRNRW
jgi:nitroreductase